MPDPTSLTLLDDFPVISRRELNWRDVDPALHVSNTKYLEWAETGRLDYFQHYYELSKDRPTPGIGPVIASINCKYLYPLTFPDTIFIGTRMLEVGNYRYILEAYIVSESQKIMAAKAKAKMVLFDFAKSEKVALPEDFGTKVRNFEQEMIARRRQNIN